MKEEIQKTFHQEGKIKNSKSALIGSVLLIVSALLPCLDIIIGWIYPEIKDAKDSTGVKITVDIWLATLYIAPVFIITAVNFKPNPKFYFFPLFMFCYTGLVYFSPVLGYRVDFLKINSSLTAFGSAMAVLAFMYLLKYIRRIAMSEEASEDFYLDIKEEFEKLNQENDKLKTKLQTAEKK